MIAFSKANPKKAAEGLLPLVYEELRKLAPHRTQSEAPGHTLLPTALVHESMRRLVGAEREIHSASPTQVVN